MKVNKIIIALLAFSLVWGVISPATAHAYLSSAVQAPAAGVHSPLQQDGNNPEDFPILRCTGTGTGGDQAALRGIRFKVAENFIGVEVRMAATVAGDYTFSTVLRRSSGFIKKEKEAIVSNTVSVPSSSETPYKVITIKFNKEISVTGSETFTLAFDAIAGQGTLYFETYGIGNTPCQGVEVTNENDVEYPTVRSDPAGFKVLAKSGQLELYSTYTSTPPDIDGSIGFDEWIIPENKLRFENGWITALNDSLRLYILIDVLQDRTDDGLQDSYQLSFDTNRDGLITPDIDLNYIAQPTTGNLRYRYFSDTDWTGLQPSTFSSRAAGFDCFFADGSLKLNFFSYQSDCDSHRVFEFAIDLDEINTVAGRYTRMGVQVSSANPAFVNQIPPDFNTDFSNLIWISLENSHFSSILHNPLASIKLDSNPIELTQAIQDRYNNLPLAADKRTVGRVYVDVDGVASPQPAKAYLYGSQGGVDLPGSPLVKLITAPTSIDRTKLNHTANFLLPATWDQGTVTFWSKAKDLSGNEDVSSAFSKVFDSTEARTYWIVPVNTGTAASPVLPSNAEIASQESMMKTVLPIEDIHFVRKSWQAIGATTIAETIQKLNAYYATTVLSWALSYAFTHEAPFVMPDQIYGFTPSGGGLSDPTWVGANGYVARGFRGTSRELTLVHEINHNLDRSATGTWGRHAPGCSAGGPDPSWPYANDDIQEVGFDTRLPWVNTSSKVSVIPGTFPDYMSYCQSGKLPTKWISPYRWMNLFDYFESPSRNARMLELARTETIEKVIYVSGQVNKGGTGELNPVLIQDGVPTPDIAPGNYLLEVQNASGGILSAMPFKASFEDVEGHPLDTAYFSFQIPYPQGGAKLVLKHDEAAILDTITASANAPTVSILEPNGGEHWSGVQTIRWSANDPDGDQLHYTILYTPDDGNRWYPVAANLEGTTFNVDMSTLPGGDLARMRVIATDGFNNGFDVSAATFSVTDNPPQVFIHSPLDNATLAPDQPFQFQGEAFDLEDGSLPEEAFLWELDGDPIGTGRQASAPLPRGLYHQIILSVRDSQGNVEQETVHIYAGFEFHLPVIERSPD
jgi:hypothetical protein